MSLACSQAARQAPICTGYRVGLRQSSASSASDSTAVSITANLSLEVQPCDVASPSGSGPCEWAALRQLYRVASEIPSSSANSRIGRCYGARILLSTASLRSGEPSSSAIYGLLASLLEDKISNTTSILTPGGLSGHRRLAMSVVAAQPGGTVADNRPGGRRHVIGHDPHAQRGAAGFIGSG